MTQRVSYHGRRILREEFLHMQQDKDNGLNEPSNDKKRNDPEAAGDLHPSQSDPQLTELEGLKQGGVGPIVRPEDEARDEDGKREK
jgi:hypothetical protein